MIGKTVQIPFINNYDETFEEKITGDTKAYWVTNSKRMLRKTDLKVYGSGHRFAKVKEEIKVYILFVETCDHPSREEMKGVYSTHEKAVENEPRNQRCCIKEVVLDK